MSSYFPRSAQFNVLCYWLLLHVLSAAGFDVMVTTIAGNGTAASTDGFGTAASLNAPLGAALDRCRNVLYVGEDSGRIRTVSLDSSAVGTLASGFSSPRGLVVSADCRHLYVADNLANRIVRVQLPEGTAMAVPVTSALSSPMGLTLLPNGFLCVGEWTGSRVGLLNPNTGEYSILKTFSTPPNDVTSDRDGNLYVADYRSHCIRRIVPSTGVMTTLAGLCGTPGCLDGVGSAARLYPTGMSYYANGVGALIVTDYDSSRVLLVTLTGVVTTLAGQCGILGMVDGRGTNALFGRLHHLAVDHQTGTLYIPDFSNHRLRAVTGLPKITATSSSSPARSTSVSATCSLSDAFSTASHSYLLSATSTDSNDTSLSSSVTISVSAPEISGSFSNFTVASSSSITVSASVSPPYSLTEASSTASRSVLLSATSSINRSGTFTSSSWSSSPAPTITTSSSFNRSSTQSFIHASPSWSTSPSQQCSVDECRIVSLLEETRTAHRLDPSAVGLPLHSSPVPYAVASNSGTVFALRLGCGAYTLPLDIRQPTLLAGGAALQGTLVVQHLVSPTPSANSTLDAVLLSLTSSLSWLPGGFPYRQGNAVRVGLMITCGGAVSLEITIPVLPETLSGLVASVGAATAGAQWAAAFSGAGSAAATGRAAAARRIILCSADGLSTGGLLGLSIGTGDVAVAFARGGVVGNVAIVTATALLLLCTALLHSTLVRAGVLSSVLRVALPSSLLPVWAATAQSTAAALPLLLDDAGYLCLGVVTLAAPVALLCALPLVAARRWQLHTNAVHVDALRRNGSTSALCAACVRWAVARSWRWSAADGSPPPPQARAAWVVLLECRVLWYPALDAVVLVATSLLGAVSGMGDALLCRAAGWAVCALCCVQLCVCAVVWPMTSVAANVHGVVCLLLTCVALLLQCVTLSLLSSVSPPPTSVIEATVVLQLLVVGVSLLKLADDARCVLRGCARFVAGVVMSFSEAKRMVAAPPNVAQPVVSVAHLPECCGDDDVDLEATLLTTQDTFCDAYSDPYVGAVTSQPPLLLFEELAMSGVESVPATSSVRCGVDTNESIQSGVTETAVDDSIAWLFPS